MSRHLYPAEIYRTVECTTGDDHYGDTVSVKYPVGAVLCKDIDGEWYECVVPSRGLELADVPYPSQLFRDHWKILPHDFETTTAPYYGALREAPRVPCLIVDLEPE